MKQEEFTFALTALLVERGVPREIAPTQVMKLFDSLSGSSKRLIESCESKESLIPIANELAEKLLGGKRTANAPQIDDADDDTYGNDDTYGEDEVYEVSGAYDADGYYASDAEFYAGGGYYVDGDPDAYDVQFDAPSDTFGVGADDLVPPSEAEFGAASVDDVTNALEAGSSTDKIPAAKASTSRIPHVSPAQTGRASAAPRRARPRDDLAVSRALTPEELRRNNLAPQDELAEYAPNEATLTHMGLSMRGYEAEAIEERDKTRRDRLALPPLPTLRETEAGRRSFFITAICLSPVIVALAALYFGLWGAVFAAEAALIARGYPDSLCAAGRGGRRVRFADRDHIRRSQALDPALRRYI